MRVGGGFRLLHQRRALLVGRHDDLDKRLVRARRFLRHLADPRALRIIDRAGLGRHVARDDLEQRRLAGAIAPDKTRLEPGGQGQRCIVNEKTPGNAGREA